METAYDLKVLLAALEKRGLNLTEEAARGVLEDVTSWFEASAKLSATPFDDIALVVLPKLKEEALKLVDKIDGEVG